MKELQRLRSQLSSADYHHVTFLILGMLTMLVGEFSTALPIAEILRNFNNGGTTVQLVNILPLANLALMYPLGPVWLQKRTVTTLFRDSLKVFIIGTVIIGLAYTLPLMLVGRIIQAVGCGMMLPMFATLISALLPEDSRFSDFNQLEDIITGVATITALLLTGMSFLILHAWQWANLLVILGSLIVYGMANEIEIDLEAQKYSIEWVNFGLSGGFLLLIGGMVLLTTRPALRNVGHWGIVDSRNRGAVASSSRDHSIVEKRFYNKTDSNGHGHHDVRLGMFDNFFNVSQPAIVCVFNHVD